MPASYRSCIHKGMQDLSNLTALMEQLGELSTDRKGDTRPMGDLFERWLDAYCNGGNLKARTIESYHYGMSRWWIPRLGEFTVGDIQRKDVQEVLEAIPRGSQSTVYSSLSSCLHWADGEGYRGISTILVARKRRPRSRNRTRTLSDAEYSMLADALELARRHRWARSGTLDLLTLLALIPLRPIEACRLTWPEVNLDPSRKRHLLWLQDSKVGERIIPLEPIAASIIARQPRTGLHVFPGVGSPHITRGAVSGALRRVLRKAAPNLCGTGVVPYTLRHSWATKAAREGVAEVTIQAILGHSSSKSTKRYMHLGCNDLRRGLGSMEQSIAPSFNIQLTTGGI